MWNLLFFLLITIKFHCHFCRHQLPSANGNFILVGKQQLPFAATSKSLLLCRSASTRLTQKSLWLNDWWDTNFMRDLNTNLSHHRHEDEESDQKKIIGFLFSNNFILQFAHFFSNSCHKDYCLPIPIELVVQENLTILSSE